MKNWDSVITQVKKNHGGTYDLYSGKNITKKNIWVYPSDPDNTLITHCKNLNSTLINEYIFKAKNIKYTDKETLLGFWIKDRFLVYIDINIFNYNLEKALLDVERINARSVRKIESIYNISAKTYHYINT